MEAAIVCAKRGHKVTLYEKSDKLGGVFIAAAAPSFKEKDRDLIAWYKRELTKYPNIEIKLNTEIKDIAELEAFVREAKFERLGVFPYSEEEGTYSAENLKDAAPHVSFVDNKIFQEYEVAGFFQFDEQIFELILSR